MPHNNGNKIRVHQLARAGLGTKEIAKKLNVTRETVRRYLETKPVLAPKLPDTPAQIEEKVLKAARGGNITLEQIADRLDRSPATIKRALDSLAAKNYNIKLNPSGVVLSGDVAPGGELIHDISKFDNKWYSFGACGDNHLGSNHERLDVLHSLYDNYEREGVKVVFNTGNWIEGEARINFHDISVFGMDAQIDYFVRHYPHRKGITTYFISGDDHEGWYQKKTGIVIGKHAELRARDQGRDDLVYLGYVEADVRLQSSGGERIMKVMHPGGGSAYAMSYAPQKIVESLQGGEKPSVLLIGHYHKMEFAFPREVFTVQTGCTVDQSVFMRKCKIAAHVGGALCRLNMSPDGQINRFSTEFFHYYDRGYYTKQRNFEPSHTSDSAGRSVGRNKEPKVSW